MDIQVHNIPLLRIIPQPRHFSTPRTISPLIFPYLPNNSLRHSPPPNHSPNRNFSSDNFPRQFPGQFRPKIPPMEKKTLQYSFI